MKKKINNYLVSASYGSVEDVKMWLEGADPNAVDYDGKTALMIAASGRNAEIVKIMLAVGANPNAVDDNGQTALQLVDTWSKIKEEKGRVDVEIVKMLLESGADPNAGTDSAMTALMNAACTGKYEIVKMLLSAGANPNTLCMGRFGTGWAALHFAVGLGDSDVEIVKLLLSAGANPNVKNDTGNTALDYAARGDSEEIFRILQAVTNDSGIEEKRKPAENTADENEKNAESLFRRAMQKVHPDRAPEHLQAMCQKLTAELNAARKVGDYRKIREIAESVGVSPSDGE